MGETLSNLIGMLLFFGIFIGILYLIEGNGLFDVKIEDFANNKQRRTNYLL
jgi:hypothetical protein